MRLIPNDSTEREPDKKPERKFHNVHKSNPLFVILLSSFCIRIQMFIISRIINFVEAISFLGAFPAMQRIPNCKPRFQIESPTAFA